MIVFEAEGKTRKFMHSDKTIQFRRVKTGIHSKIKIITL